jgi:MerR family mercuric resistance operon transcriptional regulator
MPTTASDDNQPFTFGQLAKASSVGVETIRYYQRRGLLPVPKSQGAIRYYSANLIDRIGFVKRAQTLGFSLAEVSTLLDLADGRNRRAVQAVATARLAQVRSKLSDLRRTQGALDDLIERCRTTAELHPCPIIDVLVGGSTRQ